MDVTPSQQPLRNLTGTGRKVRALALQSGASNSNMLRFQTAQLRQSLGPGVEWIIPDAPEPWEPRELGPYHAVVMDNYFCEQSAFAKRLAKGRPFTAWFHVVTEEGVPAHFDAASRERTLLWLSDFIEREAPIDLVVAYKQGVIAAVEAAECFRKARGEVPWAANIFVCPSTADEKFLGCGCPGHGLTRPDVVLPPPFSLPTVCVAYPADPDYEHALAVYGALFRDFAVLDSPDTHAFPSTLPRAAEIYSCLAEAVQTWFGNPCTGGQKRLPSHDRRPRWERLAKNAAGCHTMTPSESTASTLGCGEERDSCSPPLCEEATAAAAAVAAADVAEMMGERRCFVLDVRPAGEQRGDPFPGAQSGPSLTLLRMGPQAASGLLAAMRRDQRPVVVVATDGECCKEYCRLLCTAEGVPGKRVLQLEGGMWSWRNWEFENEEAIEKLRSMYGLPSACVPAGLPPGKGLTPQELAALLLAGGCTVLDVREPSEARGKLFPLAVRHVSYLALRDRREEVCSNVEHLNGSSRLLVAVSTTGCRSRRSCGILMERLGFRAEQLTWLRGGLRSWAAWEIEDPAASQELWASLALRRQGRGGLWDFESPGEEERFRRARSRSLDLAR